MTAGDLALIINKQGKIYYEQHWQPEKSCITVEPALKVTSKDKKLLKALKKEYGGQIMEEKQGLLIWKLCARGMQKLLSLINPFLLLHQNS